VFFSILEASDHSDVETRVRELREQLQQREREVRRLHKEQKRQKRAMLHEEEENLRKKLQVILRDRKGQVIVAKYSAAHITNTNTSRVCTHVIFLIWLKRCHAISNTSIP